MLLGLQETEIFKVSEPFRKCQYLFEMRTPVSLSMALQLQSLWRIPTAAFSNPRSTEA